MLCGPSAACGAGLADFSAGDKDELVRLFKAIFRAGELVCVCVWCESVLCCPFLHP